MMLPTDAAMTTRRSSLSGTLEALAMGLPSCRSHCGHHAWMFVHYPPARGRLELRHNIPDFRPRRKRSGHGQRGPAGGDDAVRDSPARRVEDSVALLARHARLD